MRVVKYAKRDVFSGRSYVTSLINILVDVIKRGFEDYNDFKDQLDAVDLGLVDEDIKGSQIYELFCLLNKDKSFQEEDIL